MSHWYFQIIRGSLTYRSPGLDSPNVNAKYPLWFARSFLTTLLKTCVASAMVSDIRSYDETSIRSFNKCMEQLNLDDSLGDIIEN
jgi:hypothetical protein